jgi:ribonuclease G
MGKELVISSGRHETKLAILEDGQLCEIYFQRGNEYSLAGSIHKGRVTRVLPGMQSAFVDLGLERDTFLYVTDFFEESGEDFDRVGDDRKGGRSGQGQGGGRREDNPSRRDGSSRPEPAMRLEPAMRPELAPRPEPAIRETVEAAVEGTVVPAEGVAADAAATSVAPGAERRGDRNDDRRGGRRRRRRRGNDRGGGRLPDSKYAPAPGTEEAVAGDDDEADDDAELSGSPVAEAPEEQPFMLPGETLSKYRRMPAAEAPVRAMAPTPAPEPVQQPETMAEVVSAPPVAAAAEPAVDAIDVIEPTGEADVIADAHEFGAIADHSADPVDAQVEAAADEADPERPELVAAVPEPDAPSHTAAETMEDAADRAQDAAEALARQSEALDSDLSDLDDVDSLDADGAGSSELEMSDAAGENPGDDDSSDETVAADAAEGAVGEDGQPALEPMGYSAHLREPAVRFLEQRPEGDRERGGRRRRGRGRFNRGERRDGAPAPAATGAAEAAPVSSEGVIPGEQRAARPEQAERPERSERPERTERGDRPDRGDRPERGERAERPERTEKPDRERAPHPSITDLLKEGQEVLVQIAKEPLGQKGARITSHIALPGRYCVYMPTVEHAGVSRKIESDEERHRLKRILLKHREGLPGGFIIRTAGEGKTEEEIAADIQYLYNLWLDIRQKAERKKAPALIYHDLEMVERILRDQLSDEFKSIWCDTEQVYETAVRFVQRMMPSLVTRVKMYTRQAPIFDSFNITAEIEKALRPKVWLKSGGYIVINQTEALVAIDINTGKFVGKTARLEDTIVKINIEAVKEIVRQIRLRDLGGIIVIDFIDMDERKNRQKVMQALEEAMRVDRAPYKILQFNDFGLVAVTRKRVKQSLERTLCQPCPACEGAGYVRSVQTVIGDILSEAVKIRAAVSDQKECVLRTSPEVAKELKSTGNSCLEEIEEILGRPVAVVSDPVLNHEKFDLS